MLLAHFLSLVALLFVFVKLVPTYTRVFEEAELALPAATVFVIRISNTFVMYWYLIIFLGILLDGVVVAVLTALSSRTNRLVSAYSHAWLLAVLFLLLWASVACVMPLISLVELNGANLAPTP
jgi:type II secretory pathway component PulF